MKEPNQQTLLEIEQHFRFSHNHAYDAIRGKRLVTEVLDPARKTCMCLHGGIEALKEQLADLEKENAELKQQIQRKEVTRP